ncbi:MAG: hypothetical protein WEC84_04020 [Candidatus Andersenbacteria bacterium]
MLKKGLGLTFLTLFLLPIVANAALIDRVNEAFRTIHDRTPTVTEWSYWAGRVQRKEKTTFDALVGAIAYQRANTSAISNTVVPVSVASVSAFKTSTSLYPSPHNPNFLPDGTLVKSASAPQVFYIQNGKKSWVIPGLINKWLGENHYFKHDIILTIPDADLARYPQTKSANPVYIGKILQHPDGTQYFIDDKLRKRQIASPAVRATFKIPAGNLYPTSAAHLQEFPTGPAITNTNLYPGGMVVYTGPYHGGRFWRIEEVAGGKLVKRLYLSDYIYEADGNPDESLRAPAIDTILARHERGVNIEKYPDGWVVGLGPNIYVVQDEKLRLITSPEIFAAMGYKSKYVLTVFPEFLQRYAHGHTIGAYKSIVSAGAATKGGPAPAPNGATGLTKVRPAIRALIADVNNIYQSVFDKDVTAAENTFWVDYVYNGEVTTKTDLIAAMQRTKQTGQKPARTSRTAKISLDKLKNHWFPYLFYFVHQQEPSQADKEYWYSRIKDGDRDSIEKLGGTIQWLKENQGTTRR